MLILSIRSASAATTDDLLFQRPVPKLLKGFYTGLDIGALSFWGLQGPDFKEGPLVALKIGYDLLSFAAVEISGRLSLHDAAFRGAAQQTEPSFFLYMVDGRLKLSYHFIRRLNVNISGGAGLLVSDPKMQVRETAERTYFIVGGGLEYYLKMKHLSIEVHPMGMGINQLTGFALITTGSIKYTW